MKNGPLEHLCFITFEPASGCTIESACRQAHELQEQLGDNANVRLRFNDISINARKPVREMTIKYWDTRSDIERDKIKPSVKETYLVD